MVAVDEALRVMLKDVQNDVPAVEDTEAEFETKICDHLSCLTQMYAPESNCKTSAQHARVWFRRRRDVPFFTRMRTASSSRSG